MALTEKEVAEINTLIEATGEKTARKIFLKVEAERLQAEATAANEELQKLLFEHCPALDRIQDIIRDASIRAASPPEIAADIASSLPEDERPLNRYFVNYEFGTAKFFTRSMNLVEVRREFFDCANECFGIRKSIGTVVIIREAESVNPITEGLDSLGYCTHVLRHSGDEIFFDRRYKTASGEGWKLLNESGEKCTCSMLGQAELSCEVHHFWVENHNDICPCNDRAGKAVTK